LLTISNNKIHYVFIFLGIFGILIQSFVHYTLFTFLVYSLHLIFGRVILLFLKVKQFKELRSYYVLFFLCCFWAGVSSLFPFHIDGFKFSSIDEEYFYNYSTSSNLSFEGLFVSGTESVLAISTWNILYRAYGFLGIENLQYIGISFNILLVSLSIVFWIKVVRILFISDDSRLDYFISIYSLSGIYWLFGASHLRESFLLINFSILIYCWIVFLNRKKFKNKILIISISLLSIITLGLNRNEYFSLPAVLLIIFIISSYIEFDKSLKSLIKLFSLISFTLPIFYFLLKSTYFSELTGIIEKRNIFYTSFSIQNAQEQSLGVSLILNQPSIIRVVLGSLYLFLYPIPFWTGFQTISSYSFLKTFQPFLMIFVIPRLIIGIYQIMTNVKFKNVSFIFILLVSFIFTAVLAFTSIETRHFGMFLPLFYIIALIPDMNNIKIKNQVRIIFFILTFMLITLHFSWILLKFI